MVSKAIHCGAECPEIGHDNPEEVPAGL